MFTSMALVAVISLMVGVATSKFMSQKQFSNLQAHGSGLSQELEALRNSLATKTKELTDALDDRSRQHANELLKIRDDHRIAIEALEADWKERLRVADEKAFNDGFRQAELRFEKNEAAFSVQVRPFISTIKDEGIIWDSTKSQVGFQYQLYVNGIPCFQPHVVVENEYHEDKVNDARLQWLTQQALNVARLAVQGAGAEGLIAVVETPVISQRVE